MTTVAAMLAEVVPGRRGDAEVFSGLHWSGSKCDRWTSGWGLALGSDLAVDAFVVGVADLAGGALVATVDVEDLERLLEYEYPISARLDHQVMGLVGRRWVAEQHMAPR